MSLKKAHTFLITPYNIFFLLVIFFAFLPSYMQKQGAKQVSGDFE